MLLVGSKALEQYIPINRVTHDWDIWMSATEYQAFRGKYSKNLIKEAKASSLYSINNEIFEIKHEEQFEPTDLMIFESPASKVLLTPVGMAFIPSIQHVYDMKAATVGFINEPKHQHDLKLIIDNFPVKDFTELYELRYRETEKRVSTEKKVKYDFFHKYHIPEYIVHDHLHEVIADLLDIKLPTYQKITVAETDIGEELFNKLTHDEKISLMVEESLVLALERWFIPQMIENGINYNLIKMFDDNNEGLPTYKILKHCNITGLKGEAEYITGFARANFFEIEKAWIVAKAKIKAKGGFPKAFYDQIFKLRTDYKNGKKVAIT